MSVSRRTSSPSGRRNATRPELDVHLLIWKSALPVSASQEFFPHRARPWFRGSRIHLRLAMNFSVSLGYVVTDRSIANAAQVLRDANIAMQRAKDRGRGLSQEFDAEMLEQKLDNAALEDDLKSALENGQFSVVYQPIMRLNSTPESGIW